MPATQPSKVHAFPSSHCIGDRHGVHPSIVAKTHTPEVQESVVHAFWSLQLPTLGHGVQPGFSRNEHVLLAPHESVVQGLLSLHEASDEQQLAEIGPGAHWPLAQVSPIVHTFPSSQAGPVSGERTQPVAGSQASLVHTFWSSHEMVAPVHAPETH